MLTLQREVYTCIDPSVCYEVRPCAFLTCNFVLGPLHMTHSRTAVCAFYVCLFVCVYVCMYLCIYDRGGGGEPLCWWGGGGFR